uniref:Ribosomal RNA large subunit methyltransferase H n=1 Tax=Magnetococcus massalia (strain MO-1) TaxID=451514 RepID=A0A1S7LM81_MAGMO|nr:Ribosomal RNA large subunit methyltransferase H [Candidatus Magnetococcus massalia]
MSKRFRLLSVGRGMPAPIRELVDDYGGRLKRYGGFELIEIAEGRRQGKESDATRRKAMEDEAQRIQAKMDRRVWVALDRTGKGLDSEKWAQQLGRWQEDGQRDIGLIIGGPDGLTQPLLQKCPFRLGLGAMTFPHMLVRVMVLEQLYRSMTILDGVPYHR